jgi:hypothetical protein
MCIIIYYCELNTIKLGQIRSDMYGLLCSLTIAASYLMEAQSGTTLSPRGSTPDVKE